MIVDPQRSKTMRAVRSKDTKPELVVRKLVYKMGYRYRLHRKELAGKPDLVFSGRQKVIFVHGCFWHGHDCKRGARQPKANADYWATKIERNRQRDALSNNRLHRDGWSVCVVWECELRDSSALTGRLSNFLNGNSQETSE